MAARIQHQATFYNGPLEPDDCCFMCWENDRYAHGGMAVTNCDLQNEKVMLVHARCLMRHLKCPYHHNSQIDISLVKNPPLNRPFIMKKMAFNALCTGTVALTLDVAGRFFSLETPQFTIVAPIIEALATGAQELLLHKGYYNEFGNLEVYYPLLALAAPLVSNLEKTRKLAASILDVTLLSISRGGMVGAVVGFVFFAPVKGAAYGMGAAMAALGTALSSAAVAETTSLWTPLIAGKAAAHYLKNKIFRN